ncbi:hypothetical protein CLCR_06350 [Cladophialophora carrionii]|uniref:Transaldolase n=1 Tax=Cladophialophora carrionii TaxID=86049 RepID=A0A1C1C7W9_9EURO|nr:hypothetical protein CLCR_06350 [Cladophialophora carrionii]
MSARVIHILKTYAEAYVRTGKEQPILVIARSVGDPFQCPNRIMNDVLMLQYCDSHFNTAEILAMAELGCQHVTIQAHNLQKLMETPDTLPPVLRTKPKHPYAEFVVADRLQPLATLDPLAGPGWDGVLATMETDFVADGGAKLDKFIETDAVLQRRFADACKLFLGAEEEAKAAIEKLMVAKGV